MAGSVSDPASLDALVAEVVDDFRARQLRGEQPDIEEYSARHPEAAVLLRNVLASLQLVGGEGLAATAADDPLAGTLGDFRLIREVGRGGMGVVYEAEQISLSRRVALKVLPFAATLDPRQLQRFHNEARAAASLHHTNIVPVFGVGSERGVHYYAMQFIDGHTLADAIAALRASHQPSAVSRQRSKQEATTAYTPVPDGPRMTALASSAMPLTTVHLPTLPVAFLSTEKSTSPEFFRTAANLGMQAAQALEYAHGVGVIHRDIKPANLLLDSRGNLWIADFGLAQCQSQAGPTMTGDLVGTLRYMSPEQALANRIDIDQRTDVYSLGATLYELLTLNPVFQGTDRQELLRQIAFDDPIPPRRLNKSIPAELETIVLKALEKNPTERYATAHELAEDLRRFLDDKPIAARRPTFTQRAVKWARRHRGLVRVFVAFLVFSVIALSAVLVIVINERNQKDDAFRQRGIALTQKSDALVLAQEREAEAEKQRGIAEEEWRRAEENFLAMLNHSEHLRAHGELLLKSGQPQSARAVYETYASLVEALLDSSHERILTKRKDVAWAHLEKIRSLAEHLREVRAHDHSLRLVTRGLQYADWLTKRGGAMKDFQRIKLQSLIAYFHEEQGHSLREMGRAQEAENSFRKAMLQQDEVGKGIDPAAAFVFIYGKAILWRWIAEAQLDAEKFDEAGKSLDNARGFLASIKDDDPSPFLHKLQQACIQYRQGDVHFETGRKDLAKADYEKALVMLKGAPAEEVAWNLLTCPVESLRDPKRALELLEKSPHKELVALAHYRLGNYKAAEKMASASEIVLSPVGYFIHGRFIRRMIWVGLERDLANAKRKFADDVNAIAQQGLKHMELRRFHGEAAAVLKEIK